MVGVYRNIGDVRHQNNWMLIVRDNLAYLAAGYGGIQVVDVSNPASPTMLLHYQGMSGNTAAAVYALELDGNILHALIDRFEPTIFCSPSSSFPSHPSYVNYDHSGGPLSLAEIATSRLCYGGAGGPELMTKSGITFCSFSTLPDNRNPASPVIMPSIITRTNPRAMLA